MAGPTGDAASRGRRVGVVAGVAAAGALAAALRALGWSDVFPGDGEVMLNFADASYHARRALYGVANFPDVLRFDPYLAHPTGAVVPMPPGFDWALAAAARTTGDFERTAAWISPLLSALCTLPIYAATCCFAGRAAGLWAALLYAVMPIAAVFCELGNPDHHAAVALGVAVAAWLCSRPSTARFEVVGLALLRVALALTWSGSLLVLGIGEAALLVGGIAGGGRGAFARQAAGAGLAAVLLAPFAAAEAQPAFTAVTFSWLHVVALACAAGVAGALAVAERASPTSNGGRALRALSLCALVGVVVLAIPDVRAALAPALLFLGKTDASSPTIGEQRPLFAWLATGRAIPGRSAIELYGGLAFLLPLLPLGFGLAARRAEGQRLRAAVVMAVWCGALVVLAMSQVRFGNELAPLACVGFAVLGHELAARTRRSRLAGWGLALVGAALVAPGVASYVGPKVARARSVIDRAPGEDARLAASGALVRFAQAVRRATPETSGYLDSDGRPEYAILCPAGFGHVLHYPARRATPSDNFGVWLDPAKFAATGAFYAAADEVEALAIARDLDARFVMTAHHPALQPPRIEHRLQMADGGASSGLPHLARFRLVTEGPERGRPLGAMRGRDVRPVAPYKLFEIVEGAVLRATGPPGAAAQAELILVTPIGRRLRFIAHGRVDGDGKLALRVPHASDGRTPTRALGPWRLSVGGAEHRVEVTERDVIEGRAVAVGSPLASLGRTRDASAQSPAGRAGSTIRGFSGSGR